MGKIKEILKKNDSLRRVVKNHKIKKEFGRDASDFCKHYIDADNSIAQTEYAMLLIVHSLEKGMCSENIRPFGKEKCVNLIELVRKYESMTDKHTFAYKAAISIIEGWKDIYEKNSWTSDEVYKKACEFLKEHGSYMCRADVGSKQVPKSELSKYFGLNYTDAIKTRHSVRKFASKEVTPEDIIDCIEAARYSPSACNRQMCKIYMVKNSKAKEILDENILGIGGFEKENIQYFVITFDISAFSFYGERNQGYFNAGLMAMNFSNALHFKGIGSCFLQWSNKAKEDIAVRKSLGIPDNEKIVVILAAGYYADDYNLPKSCRKPAEELFKVIL